MGKNSFGMMQTPSMDTVERLWKGSYDLHIHCAPDPSTVRRYDVLDCAREAQKAGMAGIVMKSFFYNTTVVAQHVERMVPDVKVYGSVVIGDLTTGGLDYAARIIESEAKIGCRVVWFPAFDAAYCKKCLGQEGGISVLDEAGNLKPEVYDILKVIKEYDMLLCSGHMSVPETLAVFRAAREAGITRLVATHPLVTAWPSFTMEEMRACTELGAYIEFCFGQTLPRCNSLDPRKYVEVVKELGAEHCFISTDFGQVTESSPAEGMRSCIAMMLQFGCTPEEVKLMCQDNPYKLLV